MDDVNEWNAGSAKTTWELGHGCEVSLSVEHPDRPLSRIEFRLYELVTERLSALLAAPEKMLEGSDG